ncbi:hypothetical protein PYW07_009696 [Mythimna separata]|uniref:Secreted protein n=1 Tax=Mythimna separata TaxID=271217 RepID=A0AAD8DNK3_MYTSE|nr:hypothetical protein PYW07_009696 [Mythimna separata]
MGILLMLYVQFVFIHIRRSSHCLASCCILRVDAPTRVPAGVQICIIVRVFCALTRVDSHLFAVLCAHVTPIQSTRGTAGFGVPYLASRPAPTRGGACFSACTRVIRMNARGCIFSVLDCACFPYKRRYLQATEEHASTRYAASCGAV